MWVLGPSPAITTVFTSIRLRSATKCSLEVIARWWRPCASAMALTWRRGRRLRTTFPRMRWPSHGVARRTSRAGRRENAANWLLVNGGLICVIIELALGALTGLDLALVGGSLTIGGAIGLLAGSARIGLLAGGVLALIYLAIFRSWLKSKLTVKNVASNVDAVVGKTRVVTKRIAPSEPGMVKVGAEVWRAELAGAEDA